MILPAMRGYLPIDIALGKYENPWEYEPDDLYPGII